MRNNKKLINEITELVDKARGRKLAIAIQSREDFEVFLDIIKAHRGHIDTLTPKTWDVYKYETAITIDEDGIMYYATVDYYQEWGIETVQLDLNIYRIVEKVKEDTKMHKEIGISKSKLDVLIKLLLKTGKGYDPRGLIIEDESHFDVIAKIYDIDGSWNVYKEDTCLIGVDGKLVVASYEKLKPSNILFAKFDPTKDGYINFDGIEDEAYDIACEKHKKSIESLLEKSSLDGILKETIEKILNELVVRIGKDLISDELTLEEKIGRMDAFITMITRD